MRTAVALLAALIASTSLAHADGVPSPVPPLPPPAPHPSGPTPTSAPAVRYGRRLVVQSPSPTQSPGPGLRLRTMVRPVDHLWVGPDVPAHVPLEIGDAELDLLDPAEGGGLTALYRGAPGRCGDGYQNCEALLVRFDASGNERDRTSLRSRFPRRDHIEVQDVRVVDGVALYNEACPTYSRDAGGRCSQLVALDLASQKVLWRTPFLTSNSEIHVVGPYVVTAYGFTGEPTTVRVVRRSDGVVLDRKPLPASTFEMRRSGDDLAVFLYRTYGVAHFELVGFDGPAPRLVPRPFTPDGYVAKPYAPPIQENPNTPRRSPFDRNAW